MTLKLHHRQPTLAGENILAPIVSAEQPFIPSIQAIQSITVDQDYVQQRLEQLNQYALPQHPGNPLFHSSVVSTAYSYVSKLNLTTPEDSQPIIFCSLVSHCKLLGPTRPTHRRTDANLFPKPVNHRLTLKEGPKVKSDIRRFPAHNILQMGCTLQTSRINNKRVINPFKFGCPRLTLKEGLKSNLTTSEDSQPMISYKVVSHCKPLGPIISKL